MPSFVLVLSVVSQKDGPTAVDACVGEGFVMDLQSLQYCLSEGQRPLCIMDERGSDYL